MNSESKPPTKNEFSMIYNMDQPEPKSEMTLHIKYDVTEFKHEMLYRAPSAKLEAFKSNCDLCGVPLRQTKYTFTIKAVFGLAPLSQEHKIVAGDCCTTARAYYDQMTYAQNNAEKFAKIFAEQQPKVVVE